MGAVAGDFAPGHLDQTPEREASVVGIGRRRGRLIHDNPNHHETDDEQ
jgi:hypothetical protein